MDLDHAPPETKPTVIRPLGDAQQILSGIANGRLLVVPGDGSCLFHVISQGTAGAKTVEALRQSCGCDGTNWAEEKHIEKLAQKEKFRLVVWKIELSGPNIKVPCEPYQQIGSKKAKETVHTIYWTRLGKGLHFDLWSPTGGSSKEKSSEGKDQKGSDS